MVHNVVDFVCIAYWVQLVMPEPSRVFEMNVQKPILLNIFSFWK